MRRDIRALAIAATATCFLAGCGWFHRHSEKQQNEYKGSVQERPLEVPPDLDKPNTAGALSIPEAGAAAAPAASATETAPATSDVAGTPASTAAAAPAVLGADGLHVMDSVDSVWNRVGLALERSGAATILARDEAGRTFDVQTAGQVVSKPGWFKKAITLGMAKGKTTSQARLTVRVAAEGDGSKVTVEGASDDASKEAARALLATLKSRLS
ncbi:MAG TPA: hypothetical protein VJ696_04900 [Rhodanobacteraceae bacterium]|nr:hypothetical protein [Rhodanobacteraceae bacterium]